MQLYRTESFQEFLNGKTSFSIGAKFTGSYIIIVNQSVI